MSRRSPLLNLVSLRFALSLGFHFVLLFSLPGAAGKLDEVDVELVPISAELLRSAEVQPGEPTEPPATPDAPPEPPPAGAITQGPMPPPGPGPEAAPPAPQTPPRPRNLASRRTRGLAAKLPTNVRFAVIVRPKMIVGSPHEEIARETIRRAIGMRVQADEDGGVVDPLEGLEELVVVTQNPFQAGNFAAAAAGDRGAAPPGYDKKGRDLVRTANPTRPSTLPPAPRFPWRQRLLAISDPPDGSPRPIVALVGNDVDALTLGNLRVPVPPRIDLVVFETDEHGSIARANASFDSLANATTAAEAWKAALEARCGSALLALIGLRDVCRRIEIVQEGKVVHGSLEVDSREVDKLLGLLQTTMRGRRRRPTSPPPTSPPTPPAAEVPVPPPS